MENYLTKKELAKILKVTERTLDRWHRDGLGPPKHKIGGSIRYLPHEITDWAKQNQRENAIKKRHARLAAQQRRP